MIDEKINGTNRNNDTYNLIGQNQKESKMNIQIFCEMAGVTEEELHKIEKKLSEGEKHIFLNDEYSRILVYKIKKKSYRVINRYENVKKFPELFVGLLS